VLVSVNVRDLSFEDKENLMWEACKKDQSEQIKKLIDSGFPIDQTIRGKLTPLQHACLYGSERSVSLLLSRGISSNKRDLFGQTLLHVACQNGRVSIVRELLMNGGDLNLNNNGGWTPLRLACHRGYGEVVVEILKFLSETSSRDYFHTQLKNIREWWDEGWGREERLSSYLSDELMSSLEYNLSINNEKGAR